MAGLMGLARPVCVVVLFALTACADNYDRGYYGNRYGYNQPYGYGYGHPYGYNQPYGNSYGYNPPYGNGYGQQYGSGYSRPYTQDYCARYYCPPPNDGDYDDD